MIAELFERMLARSAPIFHKISRHPFHLQLFNGTLLKQDFERFAEQDARYLAAYANGLKRIAERFGVVDRRLGRQFKWFAEEIIQSEINIHERYLRKPNAFAFFSGQPYKSVKEFPVIRGYTNHLAFAANKCEIEVALSAFATCPWLYNQVLGKLISPSNLVTNRYSPWLKSYTGAEFTYLTEMMAQTIRDHSRSIYYPSLQEQMIRAFYRSAQFELMFYDAVMASANASTQTTFHLSFQK